MKTAAPILVALLCLAPLSARAQKVYLNPSDQSSNPIAGGGNEADYAKRNADATKAKLDAYGFTTRVDQDFLNAPSNANSWGAAIFVSIHSNAGGGHGTETLYKSSGGKTLADKIQNGLLAKLPYQNRGLKYRDNLHVLNKTNMYACLTEVVFHDCATSSGYEGHPPSESAFLKSAAGIAAASDGMALGVCNYFGKSCTVAPAKGFIKGVVYKNPTLTDHIAGATVTVTGAGSKVYDGGSGWSFELSPGTYTVTASAPGYKTATRTGVVVTAGATAWSSMGLDPQPPANGTIQGSVYALPDQADKVAGAVVKLSSGASATYNGSKDFSFDVPPGDYTLTVTAAGYQQGTASAKVASGAAATVHVGLKANPGVDASTAPPDAARPGRDAAGPAPDAGEASADAEAESGEDASIQETSDGGAPVVQDSGRVVIPTSDGGCGCGSGGAGLALLMLPAALGLLVRRRRG